MSRIAVVLFNLGGPDTSESVQPFLYNLFHDPAIISLPQPFRWFLAHLISRRRAPIAQDIYKKIGGKSPLLDLTKKQAISLRSNIQDVGDAVEVFVCMRYWHPMSDEVAKSVQAYNPNKIVLLPLSPQYSTTPVSSSLKDWARATEKIKLETETFTICCYPCDPGLIEAQATLTSAIARKKTPHTRILFSAHGLPRKVVDGGDPYQWQVEKTAEAIVEAMGGYKDWAVCYQSRVGPLEWIGPSTEDELSRAAKDRVGVIIVPIAFVSDHSETLVELDIEYRELAIDLGIPNYDRVPALGTHPSFIEGIGNLVRKVCHHTGPDPYGGSRGARICPTGFSKCPIS